MKLAHTSKRMTSVDKAWLRMDTPSNLMVINAAMVFDKHIDLQALKKVLEKRLLTLDRFSQRVHFGLLGTMWRNDPGFDLDRHLEQVTMPSGAGTSELQALIAERAKRPLPMDRPLWHMTLVHGYEGGSAIILRTHHCVADGIAIIDVILGLTDADPEGTLATKKVKVKVERRISAVHAAKFCLSLVRESVRLLFMPNDSRTRFKGKPDVDKQIAWADPIPLSTVKALGSVYKATINDVMLSIVAGALRKYLEAHGDPVDQRFARTFVPVNLRPKDQEYMLGNEFGLIAADLPLGLADPIDRLVAVNRTMGALKRSAQAPLSRGILGIAGLMPRAAQKFSLDLFANRCSAVITNVTGPESARYMAGAKMKQLIGWVPQSGNVGIGVCVLSYQGTIQLALLVDKKLVPDADVMMAMFRPCFDELCSQINPRLVPPPTSQTPIVRTDAQPRQVSRAVGEN